jgi:hypothetical protein
MLVFCHTGSYQTTYMNWYNNMMLVNEHSRMIVVTLNYRLGAFGFLGSTALRAGPTESTGNYGLLDQRMAMQVRERERGGWDMWMDSGRHSDVVWMSSRLFSFYIFFSSMLSYLFSCV